MQIAKEKRKSNISEYIIYMWQIEDLIRAFKFDIDTIVDNIKKTNNLFDDKQILEYKAWYSDIIEMMTIEKIKKNGHLQVITNLIIDLNNLHSEILNEKIDKKYIEYYNKALPNIIEFSKKMKNKKNNEIEVMFNALYILLLMRMQKKTISKETSNAMGTFSQLLAYLTKKYHEVENNEKTQFAG